MRLLLDTHAVFWAWNEVDMLSASAKAAIEDPDNMIWVSPISAFELATKHHFGKLPAAGPIVRDFRAHIERFRMDVLDVTIEHGVRAGSYSKEHRDPFDRLLAAQAELEDASLVTRDREFTHFPCRTLW